MLCKAARDRGLKLAKLLPYSHKMQYLNHNKWDKCSGHPESTFKEIMNSANRKQLINSYFNDTWEPLEFVGN